MLRPRAAAELRNPIAARRPVAAQFILFILLGIIPFFFFFFNWNDHHPLAGVTKRRVLETYIYRRQLTKVINRTRLSHECAYAVPNATASHKRESGRRTHPSPPTNNSYHTHRCLTAIVILRAAIEVRTRRDAHQISPSA